MTVRSSQQLVIFSLAREEYALPIDRVQEIIRYTPPRSVASSVPSLVGVIDLRSRIIPVYELTTRLGFHDRASDVETENQRIVIVETANGNTAGLLVDSVEEVLTVDGDRLDDAPTGQQGFVDSIAKLDGRLILVLGTDSVVKDVQAAVA